MYKKESMSQKIFHIFNLQYNAIILFNFEKRIEIVSCRCCNILILLKLKKL